LNLGGRLGNLDLTVTDRLVSGVGPDLKADPREIGPLKVSGMGPDRRAGLADSPLGPMEIGQQTNGATAHLKEIGLKVSGGGLVLRVVLLDHVLTVIVLRASGTVPGPRVDQVVLDTVLAQVVLDTVLAQVVPDTVLAQAVLDMVLAQAGLDRALAQVAVRQPPI